MKKWGLISAVVILGLIAGSASHFQAQQGKEGTEHLQQKVGVSLVSTRNSEKANVKIDKDYGKMPLIFIPNQGQMDKQVYYYVQGKDKTVYFTSAGITFSLSSEPETPGPGPGDRSKQEFPVEQRLRDSAKPSKQWIVKLEFVGARKNVKPESLEQSGTVISYFKGKKKDWKTGLQSAAKILYRNLWPGIDLVYYGTVNRMKYEFIVHPGADPSQIKLVYRGANSVKENSQGQLEIQTPMGGFQDDTPEAWQEIAGKRESVALKYAIESGKSGKENKDALVVTYGFTVGKYDNKQTLVLDPAVLVYCGYIGGSGDDSGNGIAVDSLGCAYVTGWTYSSETSFPVMIGPDLTFNNPDRDAYVAKVKTDGTGLLYCGYIGGSADDWGFGIAVDASGCVYVGGHTGSTETTFPVTMGPDLTYNGGIHDAFVAKVNADGTDLEFCGYIGGSAEDVGLGIAIDASGCSYITGYTDSDQITFPVEVGPDLTYNGGIHDAFVAKIKADGTDLEFCGYIGGLDQDYTWKIAVDTSGCTYVTGVTYSDQTTFPVIVGPDLTFNGGSFDAFVAKIKPDGTGLDYCGYIGGSSEEQGIGIAVDASGCAYVTGYCVSTEATFPVIGGPDLTFNGGSEYGDAYVAKVNSDGTGLVYCGYIGGSSKDYGWHIAVDASGCAYVTGITESDQTTFPVSGGLDITFNGWVDAFVAKVKTDGTGLVYCGYIGGIAQDNGQGIVVDSSGCVYVGGTTYTDHTTFTVIVGPDLTYNGGWDVFVAKISQDDMVNFAAGNGGSLTGITTQTVHYGGNCTPVEAVPNDGYNFVNWTGTGGFVTTTDNPLTVTNVTADMMITAHFAHSNPAGWIPLEDSQYNMIAYGKAYNGNNPAAVGDWLGAFGPGGTSDCRGIAAVQANGNYYITIGSNETSGETITFQLWPLPSGPSIDSSESISFIENGVYDGLPLHFGPRGQNFALVNGWNWISFNTLPADTSFNAVFGTPGHIEQIKSQGQAAIYTGGTWIGDLTNMNGIADGIMYKVKTNQAYAFNVTGMTVPFNTPLSLVTGWNWTAYLPTLPQPVQDAVNSIFTPVNQVKSQTQSVIKIGSTLFGDLTQMEPNKGYLILMNQAGVLEYPQGESTFPLQATGKTSAVKAPAVSWPLIKGNQYNMVALGKVYYEGKPVETDGFYLGSIGPNGSSDGRSLSPIKTDGTYFATVLGNTAGETVQFKLVNSTKGKTYDVAGTLEFQPDGLKTGYDLKARSVKVTAPAAGTALRMGTTTAISWAAYEVNNVKIELYKGSKVLSTLAASLPANTGTYNWKIPTGMVAGNDYQVKVSCIDPGAAADGWTNTFTIKPAATIDLLSPNGGEVWQVKRSYDITWRSTGIENIKIELYKGTVLETVISAGTPAGTGKYAWTIPANQTQGANYKIKISAVDAGLNMGDSGDRFFSITAAGN